MIAVVEKRPNGLRGAQVIKISVTRSGKDALEQMAAKYGMKEQEIGGRVYDWFMAQDSIMQRAVLGLLEDLEIDAAQRFMQRLAQAAAAAKAGDKGRISRPMVEKIEGVVRHR